MAVPIFIVGSGRSGTELLYRLLGEYPEVTSHHEYQIHRVQPISCKYAMGLLTSEKVEELITPIYLPALLYEPHSVWVNACNKAGWFIRELDRILPDVKFIHLIRDGRKAVSSYHSKLSEECYSHTAVLMSWVLGKSDLEPPWEKKYWWPIFKMNDHYNVYPRFENLCVFWATIVNEINSELSLLPESRRLNVKLEDFTRDWEVFSEVFSFCGLYPMRDSFETAKIPVNTREQVSYLLTDEQTDTFWSLCGDMMNKFGYERDRQEKVPYSNEGNRDRGENRFSY